MADRAMGRSSIRQATIARPVRQLSFQPPASRRQHIKRHRSAEDDKTLQICSSPMARGKRGTSGKAASDRPKVRVVWKQSRPRAVNESKEQTVEVVARQIVNRSRLSADRRSRPCIATEKPTILYSRQELAERLRLAWKQRERNKANINIFLARGEPRCESGMSDCTAVENAEDFSDTVNHCQIIANRISETAEIFVPVQRVYSGTEDSVSATGKNDPDRHHGIIRGLADDNDSKLPPGHKLERSGRNVSGSRYWNPDGEQQSPSIGRSWNPRDPSGTLPSIKIESSRSLPVALNVPDDFVSARQKRASFHSGANRVFHDPIGSPTRCGLIANSNATSTSISANRIPNSARRIATEDPGKVSANDRACSNPGRARKCCENLPANKSATDGCCVNGGSMFHERIDGGLKFHGETIPGELNGDEKGGGELKSDELKPRENSGGGELKLGEGKFDELKPRENSGGGELKFDEGKLDELKPRENSGGGELKFDEGKLDELKPRENSGGGELKFDEGKFDELKPRENSGGGELKFDEGKLDELKPRENSGGGELKFDEGKFDELKPRENSGGGELKFDEGKFDELNHRENSGAGELKLGEGKSDELKPRENSGGGELKSDEKISGGLKSHGRMFDEKGNAAGKSSSSYLLAERCSRSKMIDETKVSMSLADEHRAVRMIPRMNEAEKLDSSIKGSVSSARISDGKICSAMGTKDPIAARNTPDAKNFCPVSGKPTENPRVEQRFRRTSSAPPQRQSRDCNRVRVNIVLDPSSTNPGKNRRNEETIVNTEYGDGRLHRGDSTSVKVSSSRPVRSAPLKRRSRSARKSFWSGGSSNRTDENGKSEKRNRSGGRARSSIDSKTYDVVTMVSLVSSADSDSENDNSPGDDKLINELRSKLPTTSIMKLSINSSLSNARKPVKSVSFQDDSYDEESSQPKEHRPFFSARQEKRETEARFAIVNQRGNGATSEETVSWRTDVVGLALPVLALVHDSERSLDVPLTDREKRCLAVPIGDLHDKKRKLQKTRGTPSRSGTERQIVSQKIRMQESQRIAAQKTTVQIPAEARDTKPSLNNTSLNIKSPAALPTKDIVRAVSAEPRFQTNKEKECWHLYRKMCDNGVCVSFDTVLRGMLTPTEYRLRQGELSQDL